jgi:4-diphosphocytidyl-2-C-methyl-D-erythritol kinase
VSGPLCLPAPAKLNLFLHVTGRRPDGYHCLQTVFQLLDFGDTIELEESTDGSITLASEMPGVPAAEDLTVRAAHALARASGRQRGVRITVSKRIPVGGGLGGGSSDAATTLLGLNQLWGCGLDLQALAALGVGLGADVPVFVQGHSAWAEGIGDQLLPIALPPAWYLVIHPGCGVNTAAIFRDEELTRDTPLTTMAAFFAGSGRNDCEPVVRKRYRPVADALDWLAEHGSARMSGTGSCVFAAFENEHEARQVAASVPAGWTRFVARGLDRSPVHRALGI